MTRTAMALIEALGIHPIELLHPLGEIGLWGFNDARIMIAPQAKGMTGPMKPLPDLGKDLQQGHSIRIILKKVGSRIAARSRDTPPQSIQCATDGPSRKSRLSECVIARPALYS